MRQLRAIIVLCILLGLLSITIPLRFYGTMSRIFGTLTPPPFNFSVVRTLTFMFALPSITLLLMALALYYIVMKLERVAELEVIRESGEMVGAVKKVRMEGGKLDSLLLRDEREVEREEILAIDDSVIVKLPENEFTGKEVYSEVGEFLGYVRGVETEEDGAVRAIKVERKGEMRRIDVGEVLSAGKVVIVKG